MAEKKTGAGKKLLIGFGVLALIAIIVVIIVISIPPNTSSTMDLLNKATTTSFMMRQNEKTKFDDFESKVSDSLQTNDYLKVLPKEMADVETLSITLAEVLDFYNEYIIFIQNEKVFQDNYKTIKVSLNSAKDSQKQLNAIMENVEKLTGQSSTYLQNAWVDFREVFTNWLGSYNSAINALRVAYQEGLGATTTNNSASNAILNAVADYVDVIYNDFSALVKFEKENPNATSYEYTIQGKVKGFNDFVEAYLETAEDIKNYYFDSTIKSKYEKINSYYEIYSEPDMKNAISSIELISGNAVVTKTYENVEDSANVYSMVKLFLIGGV